MNIGDIGYYMIQNQVGSAKIVAKHIVENEHDEKYACTMEQQQVYMPFGKAGTFYATIHGVFPENKIFTSKKELIESL